MFGLFNFGGGTFEANYRCYPVSFLDKLDAENGDKIFLPPSALDRLGMPLQIFQLQHLEGASFTPTAYLKLGNRFCFAPCVGQFASTRLNQAVMEPEFPRGGIESGKPRLLGCMKAIVHMDAYKEPVYSRSRSSSVHINTETADNSVESLGLPSQGVA
jgi:hypothetical protein